MRVKIGVIIIINFLLFSRISAQENIVLKFNFCFNGKPMIFRDSTYITAVGDTVQIDVCKIYLTNFRLLQKNKEVYKENFSYHLINPLKNKDSIALRGIKNKFDEMEFNIGVDSLTNLAGLLTGDLDPVFAMYWAWNSGYINAKLEGISPQCNLPQNRFEYHIGGYLAPFQSIQKVNLSLSEYNIQNNKLIINVDLSKWFTSINLSQEPTVNMPCVEATKIAKNYSNMFTIAR